jgi:5-methylcytosine-specific restriction protein A
MNNVYTSSRWRMLRRMFLTEHPLCVMCEQMGQATLADTVDHIIPHKGDPALTWDIKNLQALCKHCHDSHKAVLDNGGRLRGCDIHGFPHDPLHTWAKERDK